MRPLTLALLALCILLLVLAAEYAISPNPKFGPPLCVSVAPDGSPGNGDSSRPSISGDGRYVAFDSAADNLVPGDFNGQRDVFVYDQRTGETNCISLGGNGPSRSPAISADGRYVAYSSEADNLVSGDLNRGEDVFLYDRHTGRTVWVSASRKGSSFEPALTADGSQVVFSSVLDDEDGRQGVFLYARSTGDTTPIPTVVPPDDQRGTALHPAISADGRYVAFQARFPGEGEEWGVFVHDRSSGQTRRLLVPADGSTAHASCYAPTISANGRWLAFSCRGGEASAVLLFDRQRDQMTRIHWGEARDTYAPSLSARGRYLALCSCSQSRGEGQVFVHDRQGDETIHVSVDREGRWANGEAFAPAISADGRFVAFASRADNLVDRDDNGCEDIFVYGR